MEDRQANETMAGGEVGAHKNAPRLRTQISPCLALCSAAEDEAVRAWIPAFVLELARQQARDITRELSPTRESQDMVAKAGARVARWLVETRGSELRKSNSAESALRGLAHVSVVWTATPPAEGDFALESTLRTLAKCKLCTSNPCVCVALKLLFPRDFKLGHLIGSRGRFLRPLLLHHPHARVSFGMGQPDAGGIAAPLDVSVDIEGSANDVHALAASLRLRCRSILDFVARRLIRSWYAGARCRRARRRKMSRKFERRPAPGVLLLVSFADLMHTLHSLGCRLRELTCRRFGQSASAALNWDIAQELQDQKQRRGRDRDVNFRKEAHRKRLAAARIESEGRAGRAWPERKLSRKSREGRKGSVLSFGLSLRFNQS